jgi:hypothetical protein
VPRAPRVQSASTSIATTGRGAMTRLSYMSMSSSICVDHPMITYCVNPDTKQVQEGPIRDPWLRQHYVHNVCWMSQIIELVNINSHKMELTYDKLWRIMGKPGMFDVVEAQQGLTIEDMIPVFDWFDRSVNIIDESGLVYQRTRSQKRRYNHIRPETWSFLITEHHVYVLSCVNKATQCVGWNHSYKPNNDIYDEIADMMQHPYQKLSPLIPKKEFVEPIETRVDAGCTVLCLDVDASLDQILFNPFYAEKTLVVLVQGSLVDRVILPLIRDCNYKPTVTYTQSIVTSAVVRSMGDRGFILFKHVDQMVAPETSDEWTVYQSAQHKFNRELLSYASTFNEDTIGYLHRYVRGGLFAWCCPSKKADQLGFAVSSIDVNRLYTSTLLHANQLPTVTVFDTFSPIKDKREYLASVEALDLCLVAFYNTSTVYSDRCVTLCFKTNLEKFLMRPYVYLVDTIEEVPLSELSDGQTFVIVLAVLRTSPVTNHLSTHIQQVWDMHGLSRNLRKRALNMSIGKMGKTTNEGPSSTYCFTTLDEANTYCFEHKNAKLLSVSEDFYLCQIDPERIVRLQGCYLLHLWVLDAARWKMQETYDKLCNAGVNVLYICCDELYYPSDQQHIVDEILRVSDSPDPDSMEGFGQLRPHATCIPAEDMHARSTVIGPNAGYLYAGYDSLDSIRSDVSLMDLTHTQTRVIQPYPSEYNIQNIQQHSRLLIQATVPGAGKSHSILSIHPESTLVVCPTNALCAEFRRSYPGCTAMTLHRFLRIGITDNAKFGVSPSSKKSLTSLEATEDTMGNLFCSDDSQIENNQILLLDEIFMYPLDLLVRLRFRLDLSSAKAIYATGDRHQLPPVDDTYPWMKAKRERAVDYLFPKQMTLHVCKRMELEDDNRAMEDLCRQFLAARTLTDIKLLVRMSFRDINADDAIMHLSQKDNDYMAVCYFNHTCRQVAKRVLCSKLQAGIRLVNRKQLKLKKNTLYVNYEYEIVSVDLPRVTLRPIDDPNNLLENIPARHVEEHMHWHKTRTCHSLQGSSVTGKLLLFDLHSHHITKEFLYVALTRARHLSEVYVVHGKL